MSNHCSIEAQDADHSSFNFELDYYVEGFGPASGTIEKNVKAADVVAHMIRLTKSG
jgi:hypothetical protein